MQRRLSSVEFRGVKQDYLVKVFKGKNTFSSQSFEVQNKKFCLKS